MCANAPPPGNVPRRTVVAPQTDFGRFQPAPQLGNTAPGSNTFVPGSNIPGSNTFTPDTRPMPVDTRPVVPDMRRGPTMVGTALPLRVPPVAKPVVSPAPTREEVGSYFKETLPVKEGAMPAFTGNAAPTPASTDAVTRALMQRRYGR